jgi:hypothetical protein
LFQYPVLLRRCTSVSRRCPIRPRRCNFACAAERSEPERQRRWPQANSAASVLTLKGATALFTRAGIRTRRGIAGFCQYRLRLPVVQAVTFHLAPARLAAPGAP